MNQAGAARYARFRDGKKEPLTLIQRTAQRAKEWRSWPLIRPFFSIWVWAASLTLLLLDAIGSMIVWPIATFNEHHDTFGANWMAKCVTSTGSTVTVTYAPGFDPERRSMFCQNHISVLDGLVACAAIPHPFIGLMIHWHFRIPGYGWIMKIANSIPVFPRSSGRTAEMTASVKDRVEKNLSILVFPEGHRTLDGLIQPFKRGVFFMARDAGVPIVPLAVRGLYEVNHKGEWRFQPGEIEVYLGAQIDLDGMSDDDVTELAAHMTRIAETWLAGGDPADELAQRETA
jgi:1-acyl-sn-glycerol-3-phosphate acyltransferase